MNLRLREKIKIQILFTFIMTTKNRLLFSKCYLLNARDLGLCESRTLTGQQSLRCDNFNLKIGLNRPSDWNKFYCDSAYICSN